MKKKLILHDYYLTEIPPDLGSGYRVRDVNWKGEVTQEGYIPFEEYEWFSNRDYVVVTEQEWEEIVEMIKAEQE